MGGSRRDGGFERGGLYNVKVCGGRGSERVTFFNI